MNIDSVIALLDPSAGISKEETELLLPHLSMLLEHNYFPIIQKIAREIPFIEETEILYCISLGYHELVETLFENNYKISRCNTDLYASLSRLPVTNQMQLIRILSTYFPEIFDLNKMMQEVIHHTSSSFNLGKRPSIEEIQPVIENLLTLGADINLINIGELSIHNENDQKLIELIFEKGKKISRLDIHSYISNLNYLGLNFAITKTIVKLENKKLLCLDGEFSLDMLINETLKLTQFDIRKFLFFILHAFKTTKRDLRELNCDKESIQLIELYLSSDDFRKYAADKNFYSPSKRFIPTLIEDEASTPAYKDLLPIIRLGFLCENISNEEFIINTTEKLSCLFENQADAIEYLRRYEREFMRSKNPLYDACNFLLPPTDDWNKKWWSTIILNLGFPATQFLKWAPRLKEELSVDEEIILKKREELEATPQKKADETAISASGYTPSLFPHKSAKKKTKVKMDLLDFISHHFENHPKFQGKTPQERKKIYQLILALAYPEQITLDNIFDCLHLIGYSRVKENEELGKECLHAGLVEEDFNKCLAILALPKENNKIPAITIMGADLNHPKYRLEKLSQQDPVGFVLGHKSGCCQSVGSAGEECAIHGMSSPYSGFLVLYNERNRIVAQTWVWVSGGNTKHLVFDSLEFQKHLDPKMVLTFYQKAAQMIVDQGDFSQVSVGYGGNTPSIEGANYLAYPDWPLGYKGYRDSEHSQIILATTEHPQTIDTVDLEILDELQINEQLNLAVKKNNVELVRKILSHKKYVPLDDNDLCYFCIENKDTTMFRVLFSEFGVKPTNVDALGMAAYLGLQEICELICEDEDTRHYLYDNTPNMHNPSTLALKGNFKELSKYLKEKEQEYNAQFSFQKRM